MSTIDTYLPSQFSQQTLDLQKEFCCSDTDIRKMVRWVGCKPGVYRGKTTLFSSEDFALCSWYQEVNNYQFATILLDPDGQQEMTINAQYIFMKNVWPTGTLESAKNLELGINAQAGVIGMTIPFYIGTPNPAVYQYHVMKDLFTLNTSAMSPVSSIIITNPTPYIVATSILYAS